MTGLVIFLIVVALAFDFLNGLHDAANSIATIVSTKVLAPRYAVAWAAFFNFIAFAVFGSQVANTIGTGIITPAIVSDAVILAALLGAIIWNIVTWLVGIPSSSSHALIGGLVGAGVCKAGWHMIVWNGLGKTVAAIVVSPFTGFILALVMVLAVSWAFVRVSPFKADKIFRSVQFLSASLIRWAMAATTRRRPWASSPCCFSRTIWQADISMCRYGWSWPARRRWAWAPCWAAGGSCAPWVRASPT